MITASMVSQALNINKKSVMDLIDKKKERIEKLGLINRVTTGTKGRPIIDYQLNEKQAVYLIFSARSSDDVKYKAMIALENKTVLDFISSLDLDDDMQDRYIYLIQCTATGNKKIGVSKNPKKRLATLQTANAGRLEIVFQIQVKDAYKVESKLHSKFDKYKLLGEWFNGKLGNEEVINYEY